MPKKSSQTHPEISVDERRRMAMETMEVTKKLTIALSKNNNTAIRACLDLGAVPDWCHFGQASKSKMSALGCAIGHGNTEVAGWLIDAGATASVPKRTEEVLDMAIRLGLPEMVTLVCGRLGVRPSTDHYIEALMGNSSRVLEALDTVASFARNALLSSHSAHIPAIFLSGNADIFDFLVSTGADPSIKGMDSNHPAMDFIDWQVHSHYGLTDDQLPLFERVIAHGVVVRPDHISNLLAATRQFRVAPFGILDLFSRHVPDWSWHRLGPMDRNFPIQHPETWRALCEREEDRRLKTNLEQTLAPRLPALRKTL